METFRRQVALQPRKFTDSFRGGILTLTRNTPRIVT